MEGEGSIKWYNAEKGFGFIRLDGGDKDVFVHATAVERSGLTSLRDGQRVTVKYVWEKRGQKQNLCRRSDWKRKNPIAPLVWRRQRPADQSLQVLMVDSGGVSSGLSTCQQTDEFASVVVRPPN